MKTPIKFAAHALLFSTLNAQLSTAFAQGSLTPPGAPGVTMKTLDQVEPRKPIWYGNFSAYQPGSYYLTTNLTCGQGGIGVSADNVTIDLNGFSLTYTNKNGTDSGISTWGAVTNLTIRNGAINGFSTGVYDSAGSPGPANITLENMTITGSSGNYGAIWSYRPFTVRHCLFMSNSCAIALLNGGVVTDCTVDSCTSVNPAVFVAGGEVRHCRVINNTGVGIEVAPGVVSDCWVSHNAWSGIFVGTSQFGGVGASEVIGNVCNNNNTSDNAQHAGIRVNVSGCRVEDNHLFGNYYAGIAVTNGVSGNIVIKNSVGDTISGSAYLPGSTAQFLGPIITNTASGIITNLSPWANFSF